MASDESEKYDESCIFCLIAKNQDEETEVIKQVRVVQGFHLRKMLGKRLLIKEKANFFSFRKSVNMS